MAETINIIQDPNAYTLEVVGKTENPSVEIILSGGIGPAGPQGPQGPQGIQGLSLIHI